MYKVSDKQTILANTEQVKKFGIKLLIYLTEILRVFLIFQVSSTKFFLSISIMPLHAIV